MFPTTDVKQHCLCDFIDQEWEVNLGPEEESAIDGELLIMTRKKHYSQLEKVQQECLTNQGDEELKCLHELMDDGDGRGESLRITRQGRIC